jgi:hypothetical protein
LTQSVSLAALPAGQRRLTALRRSQFDNLNGIEGVGNLLDFSRQHRDWIITIFAGYIARGMASDVIPNFAVNLAPASRFESVPVRVENLAWISDPDFPQPFQNGRVRGEPKHGFERG